MVKRDGTWRDRARLVEKNVLIPYELAPVTLELTAKEAVVVAIILATGPQSPSIGIARDKLSAALSRAGVDDPTLTRNGGGI